MSHPVLYTKRFIAGVRAQNPQISAEQFQRGYDRGLSLCNALIGVANEVARLAICDGIEAVKKAGLYKQRVKHLCKETVRVQEDYERKHNRNFGDRYKMWLDYLDGTEAEYRRHIFNIYMAVMRVLDKHRESRSELKARLETGRICADMACKEFDALMTDLKKEYGADYTPIFREGRYEQPLKVWTTICNLLMVSDNPKEMIDFNSSADLRLAVEVLANKLRDADVLNKIGTRAIRQNIEVARQYTSEENLKELNL